MYQEPKQLDQLREILKKKRVSYDRLAHFLGTSASRLCRIMNGYYDFKPHERQKISKFLGVPEAAAFKDKKTK